MYSTCNDSDTKAAMLRDRFAEKENRGKRFSKSLKKLVVTRLNFDI